VSEFETRRDPGVTHSDRPGSPPPGETRRDTGVPPAPPTGGALIRLPGPLAERFIVVGELPVQGAESDLLLVRETYGTGDQPSAAEYVVKIFRRGYGADREVWRKLPALNSPHVVRILETGRADDHDYEVMEYAADGNLRALIPATGLEPGRVGEMAEQLAAGIADLHQAGIVHRDLKPENVLVAGTEPVRLVITDFGLSKVIEQSMVFASSSRTLAYAAPESLSGQVSPARDWWSLGMIVRELLTGRPPFTGMSETAVVDHLATRPIDNDDIADPRLRLLCQGLLARDPRRRWGGDEVRAWQQGGSPPVAAEPPAHRAAPAGDGLPFAGRRFTDRGELARALVENWDDAARYFFGGYGGRLPDESSFGPSEAWRSLRDWLSRFDDGRIELIDRHLAGPEPPDVKLLHLVRWLDPSLPPHYLGRRVTADDLPGLAALANEAPHPDHRSACLIGRALWDHDLLPVLAGFAGGAGLTEIGARWRGHVAAWNELAAWLRERIPPPVASRLPDAGAPGRDEPPVVLLTLLALAAKPAETAAMLARAAVRARDSVRDPVPWFGWLADAAGEDPLRLLTVVRTAPDAALEAESLVRDRHAAQQQAVDRERLWAERERARLAGRSSAVARAVLWTLPFLVLSLVVSWLVGRLGDGNGNDGVRSVGGLQSGSSAPPVVLFAFAVGAWLVVCGAEVIVARQLGRDYFGPWSWLARLSGAAGRGLSGASRMASGTARRPGQRGCGLLLAGGLLGLLLLIVVLSAVLAIAWVLWLLVLVAAATASAVYAGVRLNKWRQEHERQQRAALGAA
jgi:hypothetical protein